MSMKHHLTDSLLMSYSAGSLPEAFNLVVATHLTLCDECRSRALAFDAVGGAVLDDVEPVGMSEGSLQATLDRFAGPALTVRPIRARGTAPDALPEPLRSYVGGDLASVKWRPVGMGVRQAVLPTSKAASVRLLYIPGGAAMPDHSHGGMELTLVLQGAFRDETDRFGPGDIEVADEATKHTPVAEAGAACICLAATDAPLRFTRLLPRLAQSLFRI